MRPSEIQGELWGQAPATWALELEAQMQPLFDNTLAALGPLGGKRLLDAGCGTGLVASLASAAGALVSGLDASTAFVDFAGARTPLAGFRVGDIEELPYEDETFDVVTAFNSVQYATSPSAVFAELARVCAPGGYVAIGMWGDSARCETEAVFARLRSLAPPPPGTPAPLRISEPGCIEGLLEGAHLSVSGGGEVSCPFTFRDAEHAWEAHSSAGAIYKFIDAVGADKVRDTIASVLEADRKSDHELRQDNVFRYVIATKAETQA